MAQDGSKMAPDGPKMAPRWAQDGTRTVKEAMLNQVGFRRASERESIEKTKEKIRFSGLLFGGFWEAKAARRRSKTSTRRPKK